MKKFSFIYTLASALMMGAVALSGLTSCSSSDDAVADVKPDVKPETKYVYKINITAGFADNEEGTRAVEFAGNSSTAKFVAGEIIHLYKVTKSIEDEVESESYDLLKNVADGNDYITLKSEDISSTDGGRSCTITGTLESSKKISDKDVLILMYNMNNASEDVDNSYFNYDDTGNNYNVLDGATARVQVTVEDDKITGVNTVDNAGTTVSGGSGKAIFTNAQSMFRLNFQFRDNEDKTDIDNVKLSQLVVCSPSIASEYYPLMPDDGGDGNFPYHLENNVSMRFPGTAYTNGDPIYLALCFNETESESLGGDRLIFIAIDDQKNYYRGEKSAPTGGFKNGRYYRSTNGSKIKMRQIYTFSPLVLTGAESATTPRELTMNYEGNVDGNISISDGFVTIGGASVNYRFTLSNATSYVKLDGLLSLYNVSTYPFIQCTGNVEIEMSGDATIYCNEPGGGSMNCITTTGNLTLKGKGKLTLINKSSNGGEPEILGAGISASNFTSASNDTDESRKSDVSGLAADNKHTVVCTKCTTTDGLTTWTYEVNPVKASSGSGSGS